MKHQPLIITNLHECWDEQVSAGLMTRDEMYDSLYAQISGELDLSPDELTDDRIRLMGWNPSDITNNQYEEWANIVNMAAVEYLHR